MRIVFNNSNQSLNFEDFTRRLSFTNQEETISDEEITRDLIIINLLFSSEIGNYLEQLAENPIIQIDIYDNVSNKIFSLNNISYKLQTIQENIYKSGNGNITVTI
jgi:hypothetical protein